jgi:hypothetical protein
MGKLPPCSRFGRTPDKPSQCANYQPMCVVATRPNHYPAQSSSRKSAKNEKAGTQSRPGFLHGPADRLRTILIVLGLAE